MVNELWLNEAILDVRTEMRSISELMRDAEVHSNDKAVELHRLRLEFLRGELEGLKIVYKKITEE